MLGHNVKPSNHSVTSLLNYRLAVESLHWGEVSLHPTWLEAAVSCCSSYCENLPFDHSLFNQKLTSIVSHINHWICTWISSLFPLRIHRLSTNADLVFSWRQVVWTNISYNLIAQSDLIVWKAKVCLIRLVWENKMHMQKSIVYARFSSWEKTNNVFISVAQCP